MPAKQVVLVTGASTGFGRLMAETLAHHGHTVFATMRDLSGRNAPNASEIRALADRESLPLHVLELDVTNEASVDHAVHSAVRQAGRLDVAVNNAGYAIDGLLEAVTIEQANQLMDTNFFGPLRVNRAVLPYMRRQRSGLLLHVSSGAGRVVLPAFGLYCASKFALEVLAETYHYELAAQGIDSVVVEPGPYKTAVFGNMVVADDKTRTDTYGPANQISQKIMAALSASAGNPQEVANAVLSIVETPAGRRQLRYRISPTDFGVDEINSISAQIQARVLANFGLIGETAFVQCAAARSA